MDDPENNNVFSPSSEDPLSNMESDVLELEDEDSVSIFADPLNGSDNEEEADPLALSEIDSELEAGSLPSEKQTFLSSQDSSPKDFSFDDLPDFSDDSNMNTAKSSTEDNQASTTDDQADIANTPLFTEDEDSNEVKSESLPLSEEELSGIFDDTAEEALFPTSSQTEANKETEAAVDHSLFEGENEAALALTENELTNIIADVKEKKEQAIPSDRIGEESPTVSTSVFPDEKELPRMDLDESKPDAPDLSFPLIEIEDVPSEDISSTGEESDMPSENKASSAIADMPTDTVADVFPEAEALIKVDDDISLHGLENSFPSIIEADVGSDTEASSSPKLNTQGGQEIALSKEELDQVVTNMEGDMPTGAPLAEKENEMPLVEAPPELGALPLSASERLADTVSQEAGLDKKELRKMIRYLDLLFDKLPEETVREFSRSEYFGLYKKIMTELDI